MIDGAGRNYVAPERHDGRAEMADLWWRIMTDEHVGRIVVVASRTGDTYLSLTLRHLPLPKVLTFHGGRDKMIREAAAKLDELTYRALFPTSEHD